MVACRMLVIIGTSLLFLARTTPATPFVVYGQHWNKPVNTIMFVPLASSTDKTAEDADDAISLEAFQHAKEKQQTTNQKRKKKKKNLMATYFTTLFLKNGVRVSM
eukprot:scaffold29351_cov52-Attheya_sp.AAC.6